MALFDPKVLSDLDLSSELVRLRTERRRLMRLIDEVDTDLIGLKIEARKRLEISREDYIAVEPVHLYDDF